MTRVCGHCKKIIGEKCGRCGSLNVVRRQGLVKPFFTCLEAACEHRWFEGQEPPTTGICEACLPIPLRETVKAA
jgi:hypothetical protein